MRVIAGDAKGRKLRTTRDPAMRPTTEALRTVIFDVLSARVVDAAVLDLFAGAGTLGIEALSRGARSATFVDREREACSIIELNLRAVRATDRGSVVRADVHRYLARDPSTPFDLVFLDPPYASGLPFVSRSLMGIAAGRWVAPGGTVVVEAEAGHVEWPPGFREIRIRRRGRTQVSIAERDE